MLENKDQNNNNCKKKNRRSNNRSEAPRKEREREMNLDNDHFVDRQSEVYHVSTSVCFFHAMTVLARSFSASRALVVDAPRPPPRKSLRGDLWSCTTLRRTFSPEIWPPTHGLRRSPPCILAWTGGLRTGLPSSVSWTSSPRGAQTSFSGGVKAWISSLRCDFNCLIT